MLVMRVIIAMIIALSCIEVNCGDADMFFDLARNYKNISPYCVVPTLKSDYSRPSPDEILDSLTAEEFKNVKFCHSLLDPHCYDGFFKSINRGYSYEFVQNTCDSYRRQWEPCCNRTDPFTWNGPLQSYCPMYMADCTGVPPGNNVGGKPNYAVTPNQSLSKFDSMCPGFHQYCNANKKVENAARYVDLCTTLAHYVRTKNCDDKYGGNPKFFRKLAGCKKFHQYCKSRLNDYFDG